MGCELLEQLLKKTEFKNDAAEIVRRIERAGLTLDTLDDAPRFFGHKLYGHNTYQVIAAIRQAQLLPHDEPKKSSKPDISPVKSED
jgi:hypothetical protein